MTDFASLEPRELAPYIQHTLIAVATTRDEVLVAILADQKAAERLARSQGLSSLLNNMKHSGDVLLDREMVIASARTYRRLGIRPTKD